MRVTIVYNEVKIKQINVNLTGVVGYYSYIFTLSEPGLKDLRITLMVASIRVIASILKIVVKNGNPCGQIVSKS